MRRSAAILPALMLGALVSLQPLKAHAEPVTITTLVAVGIWSLITGVGIGAGIASSSSSEPEALAVTDPEPEKMYLITYQAHPVSYFGPYSRK